MNKEINYGKEAREKLLTGVEKLNNATSTTLGARGRNVLIQDLNNKGHQITKDGVTVADSVKLSDPVESLGCEAIKKVAKNTNELVGDGTTTSIVLAHAVFQEGINALNEGVNPISLQRGINLAANEVEKYLESKKIDINGDVDKVRNIATISANNDKEIGELITDAFSKVGKSGVIKIDQNTNYTHNIKHEKGIGFDRGYIHPIFTGSVSADRVELDNPYILLTDSFINDLSEFGAVDGDIPLFQEVLKKNRPLLIICDDMDAIPAQSLGLNTVKKAFISVVVKAPEFGKRRTDILNDIAVVTGGRVATKDNGVKLSELTLEDLGEAESVLVDANSTIISGGLGKKEDVEKLKVTIQEEIEKETAEFALTCLEERLAKLTGGIATIQLGAYSELELGEIKHRVEDALNAVKAALNDGIVAGGGVALLEAYNNMDFNLVNDNEEALGVDAVKRALVAPITYILGNAGEDAHEVMDSISSSENNNSNYGYDVKSRRYVDMIEKGIIDPVKVTKTALRNACSIVGTLLTTECTITNIPESNGTDGEIIPQF